MSLKPLEQLPKTPLTIKRALLSVSDKTDILPLAKSLHAANVTLLSTGGTYKTLQNAGIPVTEVASLTGFPECLDGRVKTLHPKIHGGILARTSYEPDNTELKQLQIEPIELVVVNLYPFSSVVSKSDVTIEEATEYIDIGGPTMVRAAAKNFAHVTILSNPVQYSTFLSEFNSGFAISYQTRLRLAKQAFNHTYEYEQSISNYFDAILHAETNESTEGHATNSNQAHKTEHSYFNVNTPLHNSLRYGENPHQEASIYGEPDKFIDCFHGKELSYNNYLDIDSALRLYQDFHDADPTCAIFKHTIPCGVASGATLKEAYLKAFSTDKVSPFGGIVLCNTLLDLDTATAIDSIFTEIIIAPEYSDEALSLLTQKKNRRLIRLITKQGISSQKQFRSIFGGALVQDQDNKAIDEASFQVVTKRKPSQKEMQDMLFAWKIVRHVKSNAIVFAKDEQTLGIGSGQTSRVDSSEIAVSKAAKEQLSLVGSAIASDAFFPFSDGVEAAANAGATSVIQPGGSVRDQEVIDKANELGLAMVFTFTRHFRH
ncbi:bifunctional phosphoribosylaminoimidazolecarboxamide formyltransferase/IMP cyclohydrolase [Balneolaceae bacterium]|nr:bifunctional phosphoribosylaminoimidazolecarboxamide formyltransferase/IMP cyclohydrolase [Balneolaceae bacterium]